MGKKRSARDAVETPKAPDHSALGETLHKLGPKLLRRVAHFKKWHMMKGKSSRQLRALLEELLTDTVGQLKDGKKVLEGRASDIGSLIDTLEQADAQTLCSANTLIANLAENQTELDAAQKKLKVLARSMATQRGWLADVNANLLEARKVRCIVVGDVLEEMSAKLHTAAKAANVATYFLKDIERIQTNIYKYVEENRKDPVKLLTYWKEHKAPLMRTLKSSAGWWQGSDEYKHAKEAMNKLDRFFNSGGECALECP